MSPRKARRLPPGMPRKPRGGVPRGRPGGSGDDGDGDPEAPPLRVGPGRIEEGPDGEWVVRLTPGSATVKNYRCPGCDQEITPGTAHVVVWPAQTPGPASRRHWHSACWSRRLRPSGRRGGHR